jgi:hypothetical protein
MNGYLVSCIIALSLVIMAGVVYLASAGEISAVKAAIFTGAIGQIGTIATALAQKKWD